MKRIGTVLLAIVLFAGLSSAAQTVNVDSLKNVLKQEVIKSSKELREVQKDSIILSKLTSDQLMELKRKELEVKRQQMENDGRSDMPLNGAGIVLICMLPFLFVATIVFLNLRARNRESQRRYDIYMKSIEMGQTVPEHFFDEPQKAKIPSSNLKKGVVSLAVGLALVTCSFFGYDFKILILGIIPAFIGVGFLVVYFVEKPKTDSINSDEQHG